MAQEYIYNGQTYTLDDGLSNDQARGIIENYLSTQSKEEEKKPEKEIGFFDEGSVLKETGEGFVSGLIAIPQGITELGASLIDLAADTDYASDVTKFADNLRDELGVDPEGLAGKITEVVTQFVVPGLGAAGAVSKFSKLGKAARSRKISKADDFVGPKLQGATKGEKFALVAQQATAAGLVDAAVATDGITTIGDFFEGGPTSTDREIGLKGREEAIRRLSNKLKIGLESTLVAGAVPYALTGAGKVVSATKPVAGAVSDATGLTSALSVGARGIKKAGEPIADFLENIEKKRAFGDQQNFALNTLADIQAVFRYRGYLPKEIADERARIPGKVSAESRKALYTLTSLERNLDKSMKEYGKVAGRDTSLAREEVFNSIEEFLTTDATKLFTKKGQLTKASKEARLMKLQAYKNIPKNMRQDVKNMRTQIDRLSKEILTTDALKKIKELDAINVGPYKGLSGQQAFDDIKQTITKNLNSYMRRRYKAFEKASYLPDEATKALAVAGYKANRTRLADELTKIAEANKIDDLSTLGINAEGKLDDALMAQNNLTLDGLANRAVDNFLSRYKVGQTNKGNFLNMRGFVDVNQLQKGLFNKRAELADFEKRLLGEIKDPKESFLGTIADLAQFKATDDYFKRIKNISNSNPDGIGSLFLSPERAAAKYSPEQLKNNFTKLTGKAGPDDLITGYGSLEGFYAPNKVASNLKRAVLGDADVLTNSVRALYSGFLKAKGYTQYGKTVLSPITQIRNFTTASLFAAAQGNVGRGANLMESMKIGFAELKDLPTNEAVKRLEEYDKLGILGTQAEVQEIKKLIDEGFGFKADTVNGIRVGRQFGSRITDTTFGAFLGKGAKKFETAYQASDNVWKIYNYNFERSKILNALRTMDNAQKLKYLERNIPEGNRIIQPGVTRVKSGEVMDKYINRLINEEAADIVRNTVPNYNLAPQAIQLLRRSPVGNFIAFPYEILRTGGNTIKRGLDELASENAEIQKIGLRRLSGAALTFGIVPAAISEFAYQTSGVSEEQMKAYQRSMAPPWEKNARLIPIGRDEEGNIQYINYSYSNPYDLLERIAIGAINKYETSQLKGKNTAVSVMNAFNESMSEIIKPFTEESIALGKLRDVLDPESEVIALRQLGQIVSGRAGRTMTGAKVYNEEDSVGDKIAKSFKHMIEGFVPSAVPINVKGGEVVPSRFARGVFGGHLGIDSKDRQGRIRTLQEELFRGITGITPNTVDAEMGLKFKGYEFSQARKNASSLFNSVARRANVSKDELLEAYKTANEARFRVFNEFHVIIQDLKKLGKSEREIMRLFRQNGITGVRNLVRGRYEPLPNAALTIRRAMRREGTIGEYPRAEINEILRGQKNRKFTVSDDQDTQIKKPETTSRPIPFTRTKMNQPVTTASAPIQPTSNLNTGQQINASLISLLGSNPIEAAKNMQIAQRKTP
tara:strand:+ start:1687 stop:6003 length:4317 start_codon:yes stop_codon:yes gene_type:complete